MQDYIDPTIPPHMQALLKKHLPYPPSNVIPKASIMGAVDDPNTIGWVDPKMASTMFINKARQGNFPRNTGAHELEHMLQFDVNGRYPVGYDGMVLDNFRLAHKESKDNYYTPEIRNILKSSAENEELHAYLSALVGEPVAPYLGKAPKGDGWFSLKEQFAELSSIEQLLKRDLTKDPKVKKMFFADNEDLIRTYKATTGLRTNRMDPRDLEPMDYRGVNSRYPAPPEKPQGFIDKLKAMLK